jgi:hypothetical protein
MAQKFVAQAFARILKNSSRNIRTAPKVSRTVPIFHVRKATNTFLELLNKKKPKQKINIASAKISLNCNHSEL